MKMKNYLILPVFSLLITYCGGTEVPSRKNVTGETFIDPQAVSLLFQAKFFVCENTDQYDGETLEETKSIVRSIDINDKQEIVFVDVSSNELCGVFTFRFKKIYERKLKPSFILVPESINKFYAKFSATYTETWEFNNLKSPDALRISSSTENRLYHR